MRDNAHSNAAGILDAVLGAVEEHGVGRRNEDGITLVIVKVCGP